MKILPILALALCLLTVTPAFAANLDMLAKGGTGGWVNTERPLTRADLDGRVLLLDFWTYGCINCMQVIPDLDYLEKKFPNLLVIGVHSAKYQGEGLNARIKSAAQRFGLHHPVMNDNDYKVWDAFNVQAWPTLVVIDAKGNEVTRVSGEGHRAELESAIAKSIGAGAGLVQNLVDTASATGVLSFPSHIKYADTSPYGEVMFISDSGHNRIVVAGLDGQIKATIGSGVKGLKDGDLKTAQFNHPHGTALVNDILYVADTDNHALRAVDFKKGTVTTLAGDGTRGSVPRFSFLPGKVQLASPWDVEPLWDGNTLAIAMAGMHQLWQYDISSGKAAPLAGSGREDIIDGSAADAALAQPSALSLLGQQLYFVDAETSSLREMGKDKAITSLIGRGLFDFGATDGTRKEALMQHAQGLFAAGDKIYVADTYNNAIRIYDLAAKTLSTLKLTGGTLNEPGDLFVKGDTAYVADTGNHKIEKIDLKTGALSEVPLAGGK